LGLPVRRGVITRRYRIRALRSGRNMISCLLDPSLELRNGIETDSLSPASGSLPLQILE
jgi:hypothetical protein